MRYIFVVVLSLGLSACSLFGHGGKKAAEVVPSCFSDGENQELFCKAQRTNEEGKTVVTRCIGSQNQEAKPALRGKCVEKICSEGSNNDCSVRGEFAVLEQYAELANAHLFASDESGKKKKVSSKKHKGKGKAAPVTEEVAVSVAPDTLVVPDVPEASPAAEPAPKRAIASAKPFLSEEAPMTLTLKPASKSRGPASVKPLSESGFKKVCVPKGDFAAPGTLRGKCATRTCANGKCTYQGRREMFEWAARSGAE